LSVDLIVWGPHVLGLINSFVEKLIVADCQGTCGIVCAIARTKSAEPLLSASMAMTWPLSGAFTPLEPRRM
jgi:hypothetical protein